MNTPAVSVVLPTFNRSSVLGRSVQSVLDQTYRDFELIVVDDGSTDDTNTVLEAFADPRVVRIRHEVNRGGNAARNTGIGVARGHLVAFQDSDDVWRSHKLERQISELACHGKGHGACASAHSRLDGEEEVTVSMPSERLWTQNQLEAILSGSFISTQTMVADKTLLLEVGGFDEKLVRLQDWDLCIRLAQVTKFAWIEESLVDVYVSPDSVTHNRVSGAESYAYILEKYSLQFEGKQKLVDAHMYMIGSIYLSENQKLKSKEIFRDLISRNYFDIKALIKFVLSHV